MTDNATRPTPLTLLGLGAMGTALARAWLAAGHPLTVWNRTPGRADALVAEGATATATAAEAVAASRLVVVCLLDDASVGTALADADLAGKDVVNLTTSTPGEARERAAWAAARGARFLDGGIMAVPPMIGVPGASVFYSGSADLFEERRDVLAVVAATAYVGADAGLAALHDVALLTAMTGMFAGVTQAFALVEGADVARKDFAGLLADWLGAMAGGAHELAAQLDSGDLTRGVVSNLAMMTTGNGTLVRTAAEQGVGNELLAPFMALMERRVAAGHGDEGLAGLPGLLRV
ncbi:NAD(P)-dependent oxidoreductase [Streptomyces avicenniae]|uniref:NAD(P)-dependent oxidoreductase n=1 Tax=Streptomyces avicenniae TaxID=500153 RepID=UPI00069C5412|nr:NAD(P)-binding domain-containing protein [Streptomyces avicenniae]